MAQRLVTKNEEYPEYKNFEKNWLNNFVDNWASRALLLESHVRLASETDLSSEDLILEESLIAFGLTMLNIFELSDGDLEEDDLPELYEALPKILNKPREEVDKLLLDKALMFNNKIDWDIIAYFYQMDLKSTHKIADWITSANTQITLH